TCRLHRPLDQPERLGGRANPPGRQAKGETPSPQTPPDASFSLQSGRNARQGARYDGAYSRRLAVAHCGLCLPRIGAISWGIRPSPWRARQHAGKIMDIRTPSSTAEFAEAWGDAYRAGARLREQGAGTKLQHAGAIAQADIAFDTSRVNAVSEYEPRDLTIRVGAGMPYADLMRTLAAEGQMLPLDPPFHGGATVGGVVAANICGPRRRAYGTV